MRGSETCPGDGFNAKASTTAVRVVVGLSDQE